MKGKTIIAIVFSFCVFFMNAQIIDDMEYENGEIPGPWWYGCAVQGGSDCIGISDARARSGSRSGYIPDDGTTDVIFDLGSQVFGQWGMEFYMFVPFDKEAYWNLQGQVPVNNGEFIVGNIYFNPNLGSPGVGLIDDSALGAVNFTFPHNEWFKVIMNWDLSSGMSTATWELDVAGITVIPSGTPFTDNDGNTATSLGGIDFFSISANNEYWLDDFYYTPGFIDTDDSFTDDMEYSTTEACATWWTTWQGEDCPGMIGPGGANGTQKSGHISEAVAVDALLDLGNQTYGIWNLYFYMYVPAGKVAYFNLQGQVPITSGQWVVGNIYFNQDNNSPGVGVVDDSAIGPVNFSFPHDEWFEVKMEVDITDGMVNATWRFFVDNTQVIPLGTPFTNSNGTVPASLGGINFFPLIPDNDFFIDEFVFSFGQLGVEDQINPTFALYPNPTTGLTQIASQETILNIKIYNLQGILIDEIDNSNSLDISEYASSIYFVKVKSANGTSTKKLIKE